jgi:DNA-binding NarL/FixJ family response regulator
VLELVREGAGNREIAPALSIGEATVKADLLRIYAKLGVNDRTAAVVTALERGLLVL